jgi:hypothetical protein
MYSVLFLPQDETGVCKNLLQETAQRAGVSLPVYTTTRSGPGHLPVFTCSVEVAGMTFSGEAARTKKQAEKNAAMAAWSALKQREFLAILQSSVSCYSSSPAVLSKLFFTWMRFLSFYSFLSIVFSLQALLHLDAYSFCLRLLVVNGDFSSSSSSY